MRDVRSAAGKLAVAHHRAKEKSGQITDDLQDETRISFGQRAGQR